MDKRDARYCGSCSTRLARDNTDALCAACRRQRRALAERAPTVPVDFWTTDQMRDALSSWNMGRVIAAFRNHPFHGRPLPQAIVAGWVGISQVQLSRIETGPALKDLDRLMQWARILAVPPELLWFQLPEERTPPAAAIPSPSPAEPGWVDAGSPSPVPALLKAHRPLANGTEALDWLGSVFSQHVQAEPFIGPQLLLPSVQPQLAVIRTLCQASSGQLRSDAFQVGARFAEFCGWLYQDAGDTTSAAHWTAEALDYAQMDGDPLMISYVLMRKANIAAEAGEAGHGIGLAEAALRVSGDLPPRVRAASLRVKASGAALLGERTTFSRAIEEATELAAQASGADEPDDPARYCTPSYVQMEEATSLVQLGRPQEALRIFEHGLVSWPHVQRRDRGLCLARMATAYAMSEAYDEALRTGTQAATVARETGSDRIAQEIERLRTELARRRMLGVLSELDQALAAPPPGSAD